MNRAHGVVCAAGHRTTVRPTAIVHNAQGVCRYCARHGFDYLAPSVVYLITHPQLGAHKVGITGVDTTRLEAWRKHGWQAFKTRRFGVGHIAREVEQSVLRWLREELGHSAYLDAVQCPNGHTETVSADSIDLPTIWAKVQEFAVLGVSSRGPNDGQ